MSIHISETPIGSHIDLLGYTHFYTGELKQPIKLYLCYCPVCFGVELRTFMYLMGADGVEAICSRCNHPHSSPKLPNNTSWEIREWKQARRMRVVADTVNTAAASVYLLGGMPAIADLVATLIQRGGDHLPAVQDPEPTQP